MSEPYTLEISAPLAGIAEEAVRGELLERRRRLEAAQAGRGRADLAGLLSEVDAALERLDAGLYGTCTECRGPIELDRLLSDPLVHVCLDCLTPEQARALERDLETAARVQASLLPPRELRSSGWEIQYEYRPHGPVSGDYVDLILPRRPDGALWFLFGDVSGKGVAASILMASLQALFRSLIAAELPLVELLRRANRLFGESTPASAYATLVAGRLSPAGEIELASAGHLRPLLRRGGAVVDVPVGGLPLGLFSSAQYEAARLRLEGGDALFLYTDGLSEAVDGNGQTYSLARLGPLLGQADGASAGEISRRVLADLEEFRANGRATDDLALMTVRRLSA